MPRLATTPTLIRRLRQLSRLMTSTRSKRRSPRCPTARQYPLRLHRPPSALSAVAHRLYQLLRPRQQLSSDPELWPLLRYLPISGVLSSHSRTLGRKQSANSNYNTNNNTTNHLWNQLLQCAEPGLKRGRATITTTSRDIRLGFRFCAHIFGRTYLVCLIIFKDRHDPLRSFLSPLEKGRALAPEETVHWPFSMGLPCFISVLELVLARLVDTGSRSVWASEKNSNRKGKRDLMDGSCLVLLARFLSFNRVLPRSAFHRSSRCSTFTIPRVRNARLSILIFLFLIHIFRSDMMMFDS